MTFERYADRHRAAKIPAGGSLRARDRTPRAGDLGELLASLRSVGVDAAGGRRVVQHRAVFSGVLQEADRAALAGAFPDLHLDTERGGVSLEAWHLGRRQMQDERAATALRAAFVPANAARGFGGETRRQVHRDRERARRPRRAGSRQKAAERTSCPPLYRSLPPSSLERISRS